MARLILPKVKGVPVGRLRLLQRRLCPDGKRMVIVLQEKINDPGVYWVVEKTEGKKVNPSEDITLMDGRDFSPYKNNCWNCKSSTINSENDKTCPHCHWVKCPVCGACRLNECVPDGINVDELRKLIPAENPELVISDAI